MSQVLSIIAAFTAISPPRWKPSAAVYSLNALIITAYWKISRCIVEFDQDGQDRTAHGQALIERLAVDLT
ncbi:MAG: hypothetical protein V9G98_05865 [Candidatus Competibacter sp.]